MRKCSLTKHARWIAVVVHGLYYYCYYTHIHAHEYFHISIRFTLDNVDWVDRWNMSYMVIRKKCDAASVGGNHCSVQNRSWHHQEHYYRGCIPLPSFISFRFVSHSVSFLVCFVSVSTIPPRLCIRIRLVLSWTVLVWRTAWRTYLESSPLPTDPKTYGPSGSDPIWTCTVRWRRPILHYHQAR